MKEAKSTVQILSLWIVDSEYEVDEGDDDLAEDIIDDYHVEDVLDEGEEEMRFVKAKKVRGSRLKGEGASRAAAAVEE